MAKKTSKRKAATKHAPHKPKGLKCTTFFEDTLCKVSAKGNINQMRRLLEERVEINFIDGNGLSPLHYASRNGKFEAIKFLLNNWADVDITNAASVTPIFLAAKYDHVDCVKLLILLGADANKQCATKCTPREFAPIGSESRKVIESALGGVKPQARELFHLDDPPLVPKFSIPLLELPKKSVKVGSKPPPKITGIN